MNYANMQICDNCKKENPLYRETCVECGHYLRATVVNIDFWKTIWQVFGEPGKAIGNIIFAEHKNFVPFLLLLLSAKFYSLMLIAKFSLHPLTETLKNSTINALIIIAFFMTAILLFTLLFTLYQNSSVKSVRFKDNLSLIVYSFIPLILISIILLPIEYGIFGKQWFIFNPSPLVIKRNAAYLLYGIEILMFWWSMFILFLSFKTQTNSALKGILFALLFATVMFALVLLLPLNFV